MNTILFDDKSWSTLRPLTLTRPVSEIRVGILTLREKWERRLNNSVSYLTSDYLQEKYPLRTEDDNLWINASVCANADLVAAVRRLESNDLLLGEQGVVIAVRGGKQVADRLRKEEFAAFRSLEYSGECTRIIYPYHVFAYNAGELLLDFDLLTKGRKSAILEDSVRVHGKYPVFLEEGAVVRYATINTDGGPVYIGKEAEIMEGVLIRGPLAMCEHAVLNMGAKVYGATTLGPYCKCGGELNNVVFIGYSNKAHDGFLGNSVIGEWCNLGADTNNSNLKNTYVEVKLWDYDTRHFRKTGLQFCGLIMGDHSKMGINTMINTGTVVGVGANIFGSDFPRNFIPSFSWGGASGFVEHQMRQFTVTAEAVMKRRGKVFDDVEKRIIDRVFEDTREFRTFK
ncbi:MULTISPECIES: GlmU family protein [Sanguibacteroides]|uniref:Glucose-1-phosphate thymidylyltransferase n=1 Tax=Sanguibacteroides justesenii TaxID=1547597 RepID=A0A0C3R267_9PORP|nr:MULTISPECIES: GlmU family protein [Sanguibacteroides]KIO42950.1 glucose-1-phosphate thymidylyltransferase [Sanguibacteroides justesenii]KIO46208.1 glucose-1-phosphate thymidylyltransferase [Sanguibacteroides justesenii]PXZ44271.1 glucose-1-phosphate thymidylyltransferase [Sanguibacteroides justesenii]